jgi:Na+-transporting methylmalonyl-CoA/oxaloacetate decarboxylase gamma subunit
MSISLSPVRKKEVSMVVAILFILVFVLPVISTLGEAASPTFTATRSISPDDITPGSTFKVQVTLNVNQNGTDFELDEVIPTDWTVVSADSAGTIFNASDLKWTWNSVSAGETKTVSYNVVVPSNSTEKGYPISGVITAPNATTTDVGGELTVAVKTPSRKTPDWLIGTAIAMLILIFIVFVLIIIRRRRRRRGKVKPKHKEYEKELAERRKKHEEKKRRLKELEERGFGEDEEFKELKRSIEEEERKLQNEYK